MSMTGVHDCAQDQPPILDSLYLRQQQLQWTRILIKFIWFSPNEDNQPSNKYTYMQQSSILPFYT